MRMLCREMYDRSTKFWSLLYFVCQHADLGRVGWRLFWASQLRFYRQMLMAAKVSDCWLPGSPSWRLAQRLCLIYIGTCCAHVTAEQQLA